MKLNPSILKSSSYFFIIVAVLWTAGSVDATSPVANGDPNKYTEKK